MQLCLNQITAGRQPPADAAALARDLNAMREGGWTAIELWLRHWDAFFETEGLVAARRLLDGSGMAVAGACGQPGLFFSTGDDRRQYWGQFEQRLEQCQALGAPHLVVTPGTPSKQLPEIPSLEALAQAADSLRAAGDLAARYGVRLGIEFLKMARLVNNLPTAVMLTEQIDHPHVGVLVDTFHLYAGLSKVEDLVLLHTRPDLLVFVHVNDVPAEKPRELWVDPDRVLPGDGSFPLAAVFDHFRRLDYRGYVSLELFNESFANQWEQQPVAAARAAYQSTAALL